MLKDDIKALLETGGIMSRSDLARHTGETDRQIRRAISELRDDGVPVCTAGGGGYFIGSRAEYQMTTIADYKSRIKAIRKKIDAFERMPLPGQMEVRP